MGSIFATFLALIAFGFALNSTGLQLISDCSEAVRAPLFSVLLGLIMFLVFGFAALLLDLRASYSLVLGIAVIMIIHYWVQGKVTDDVLNSSCSKVEAEYS